MLGVDRGLTTGEVGVEAGCLVAPVELVEPYALEQIVLHTGEGGGLVETSELEIRGYPGSNVESIEGTVSTIRDREQGVVGDVLRKEFWARACETLALAYPGRS